MFTQIKEILTEIIFPSICLNCEVKGQGFLCSKCTYALNKCAKIKKLKIIKSSYVDNIFYFTEYKNSLIRSLIWQLKFKYSKEIVAILVNCYLEILKKYSFLNNYLFVPVPCSYVNLKKRGFSQSKLLIDGILKKQQLDFIDLLIKRRKIAPQKERSLKSRNNLSGKDFVLDQKYSHKIANKNVLLLDDICTTGQTINACAETLKKYGAKSVSGIVLAQTPKRQDTNLFSINL